MVMPKLVYNDLLVRLNTDINNVNTSAENFGGAGIIYGGNITSWIKFANSFKFKIGMTIADGDNAKSIRLVTKAAFFIDLLPLILFCTIIK